MKPHFALGTVYHALLEGLPEEHIVAWGTEYEAQLGAARGLYAARLKKGPPMGEALHKERTLPVPGIPMTSKPDREEETVGVREFKTSGWHGKYDAEGWAVHGGMLGELLASGQGVGVVDVIDKSTGRTLLYPVEMTPKKKEGLFRLIEDLSEQLHWRLRSASKDVQRAFPRDLRHCVTRFGPCEYYARCWSSEMDSMVFRRGPVSKWAVALGTDAGTVTRATTAMQGYDDEEVWMTEK